MFLSAVAEINDSINDSINGNVVDKSVNANKFKAEEEQDRFGVIVARVPIHYAKGYHREHGHTPEMGRHHHEARGSCPEDGGGEGGRKSGSAMPEGKT